MICELCNWINRTVPKILDDDTTIQQCVYSLKEVIFTLICGGILIIFSPVLYPIARILNRCESTEFKCKKARK